LSQCRRGSVQTTTSASERGRSCFGYGATVAASMRARRRTPGNTATRASCTGTDMRARFRVRAYFTMSSSFTLGSLYSISSIFSFAFAPPISKPGRRSQRSHHRWGAHYIYTPVAIRQHYIPNTQAAPKTSPPIPISQGLRTARGETSSAAAGFARVLVSSNDSPGDPQLIPGISLAQFEVR
jgi:hypothetical protein